MILSSRFPNSRRPPQQRPPPPPTPLAPPQPTPPTMAWGASTWNLLHTLCQKLKLDMFETPVKRQEFRDILISICVNLPCPDCSNHSKNYIRQINFDKLIFQSKEELMKTFFDFHNVVNERKGYAVYAPSGLDKYTGANTKEIIKQFFKDYDTKNKMIPRMISEEFYRKQVIRSLYVWFSANIDSFEP